MLIAISGKEKGKYEALIEKMFRLRYEHFIRRRNWSLPSRDGLDIDQYDADDAVYFLLIGDDGSIEATARLNHTPNSSLLADMFPFLIESDESPRGEHLFEGTRFIVAPKDRTREAVRRAKSLVLGGLVEWCLERGGTSFQAVIDASMLPGFVEMSLRTRPMGLAQEYGGGVREHGGGRCLAFRWDLTPALLADLRAFGAADTRPTDLIVTHDLEAFH